MSSAPAPLYAAADVHGHRAEFQDTLRDAGLADADGHWPGGRARLWLLGDYVDRGPDGIGVIEDIRRLAAAALTAGGRVGVLLGGHEVQLLAAHRPRCPGRANGRLRSSRPEMAVRDRLTRTGPHLDVHPVPRGRPHRSLPAHCRQHPPPPGALSWG
ncbi:metallophosphoesterase [Kitasatospora phosalacinea]|uniref:Metallophosphoesterase n=1 Tax=Kitasatospora phosalacinea TaxID=2065 RepID=A0ABW6GLL5_9ACTN